MLVSKGRKIVSKLYVQVLIGIVAGILVGHFYPDIGSQLKPLGDLFIKLIRMLLAPIIFASVVVGIARMNDLHEAGRVGVKAVVYFEVASTIALLIGMVVVNVIKPGSGMNVDPSHIDGAAIATYTHAAKQHGMLEFFMSIVPNSIVGAFANGRNAADHFLLRSSRHLACQARPTDRAVCRHAGHVLAGHVRGGADRHVRCT